MRRCRCFRLCPPVLRVVDARPLARSKSPLPPLSLAQSVVGKYGNHKTAPREPLQTSTSSFCLSAPCQSCQSCQSKPDWDIAFKAIWYGPWWNTLRSVVYHSHTTPLFMGRTTYGSAPKITLRMAPFSILLILPAQRLSRPSWQARNECDLAIQTQYKTSSVVRLEADIQWCCLAYAMSATEYGRRSVSNKKIATVITPHAASTV